MNMIETLVMKCGNSVKYDTEDAHLISCHTWHSKLRSNGQRYACTNIKKDNDWRVGFVYFSMHRLILSPPENLVVDHIDGDGLNNSRSNLRICSQQQNAWNMRPRNNTASRFKGVTFDPSSSRRKPWCASIRIGGKRKNLGRFADEISAAAVYDAAALNARGEFAILNLDPSFQEAAARAIGGK